MLQNLVKLEAKLPHRYRITSHISRSVIHRVHQKILRFYKGDAVSNLISKVRGEVDCQILSNEAFMVWSVARAQSTMPGVMAEVGVYQGASAKLICEAKGDVEFHVFDTFEGLVDVCEHDPLFRANEYAAAEDSVRRYLSDYPNVHIHKGYFPQDTADAVADCRFSFVNLDVDTYASTKNCLEFFYPRLLPGGILMSHDYAQAEGVRRAFDEVLGPKPESVIELAESQCLFIRQG